MSDDSIRRVADELAVRNLTCRLAQLADEGDLDDYVACFTKDAVWDGGEELGTTKGHEEIRAAAMERRRDGRAGPGTHSRHEINTQTVEVEGDHARSRAIFHYYTGTDATPTLAMIGVYEDEYTRTDQGWRLSKRLVKVGQ